MSFSLLLFARRLSFETRLALMVGVMVATMARQGTAQVTPLSRLPAGVPLLNDSMPPGMIGAIQLKRQPNLQGYYQPIELRGPKGVQFALACDGMFGENQPQPVRAAFLVGQLYRFRVVGLPDEPGAELFPSVEIIDRTYPPAERDHRFPIPIEIDKADIEAALRGDLVTRVIYLEDSTYAEPQSYAEGPQRVFDVPQTDDTLRTADAMGRPLAILRIGSRIPAAIEGPEADHFLFGSPPWLPIKSTPVGNTLSDISQP